jgi:excisionase family DNA binding protein
VYIQTCEMTPDVLAAFDSSVSLFRAEPSRMCLLDYVTPAARLGSSNVLGSVQRAPDVIRPNQKGAIATGLPASNWLQRIVRCGHPATGAPPEAASSGNLLIPELSVSHPDTLPDQIERISRALTAVEVAEFLSVSRITVFKLAKAGRIPSFRIGTCVRFDPRVLANWLRGR